MTMLPQLRESLVSAAGRLEDDEQGMIAGGRFSRIRPGMRSVGRGLVPMVAILTALLVAAVALTSLHGRQRAAGPSAAAAAPGAVSALPAHVPNTRQGLMSILGLLRRPQTASDLPQDVSQILDLVSSLSGPIDRPLTRYAQTTPWGQRLFIIAFPPLTSAERQRLEHRLHSGVRGPNVETAGLLAVTGRGGSGGGGGEDVSQIENGESGGCYGNVPAPVAKVSRRTLSRSVCAEIIPDGVARVVFEAARSAHGDGPGSVVEIDSVQHNVVAYRSPRGRYVELWYSADGAVLRRLSRRALPSSDA